MTKTSDASKMKSKYNKAMNLITKDAKNAPENRVLYLWYGAYLDDFTPTAGYKGRETPADINSMKCIDAFEAGKEVTRIVGDNLDKMIDSCLTLHKEFRESVSEENRYMQWALNQLAEDFPVRYGTNVTCPPFWRKVARYATARADILENNS